MQVKAEYEALSPIAGMTAAATASVLASESADAVAMVIAETSSCLRSEMAPSTRCVGYCRTSSAANVGSDKDSETRQRIAIQGYADRAGLQVAEWFYDAAVKGADAIDARPGFTALLQYAAEHGVKVVVVENASRFARDLIVQETGFAALKRAGFTLIASDDEDAFTADTATAVMVRQVLGAVSQFQKAELVGKLRGARDRKSAMLGRRCEVRHGYDLTKPELVAHAKLLRSEGKSQRAIASELAALGFVTATGRTFSAGQVGRLLQYV